MQEIKAGDEVLVRAKVIRTHGNPTEPDYFTADLQLPDGSGVRVKCSNFAAEGSGVTPEGEVEIVRTPPDTSRVIPDGAVVRFNGSNKKGK